MAVISSFLELHQNRHNNQSSRINYKEELSENQNLDINFNYGDNISKNINLKIQNGHNFFLFEIVSEPLYIK